MTKKSEELGKMNRRTFLKTSTAAATASLALGGLPFKTTAHAKSNINGYSPISATTKIVHGSCTADCGCRCLLSHHVENDVVVRTESDYATSDTWDSPQARGCLKGRSTRHRLYTPNRLKYPMKRVGRRGEGRFERISWDKALDIIADKIKDVKNKYGNESLFMHHGMGVISAAVNNSWHSISPWARLMNLYGGYLGHHDSYSSSQIHSAFYRMYGKYQGNSIDDLQNTDLFVNWGNNFAEMSLGGGQQMFGLAREKNKRNFKMIYIDPRYSDTCCGKEDQWVPIRPGTDAALAAALAYVMITEDLVEQAFLDKYCVGFDEKTMPSDAPKNAHYKAYILGEGEDRTPKTPQWAEEITGVSAATTVQLAREIAGAKKCNIMVSRGINRHAEGESTVRAICTLASLTGNVGINGGNTGLSTSTNRGKYSTTLPAKPNPVKKTIPVTKWLDGVERRLTAKRDRIEGGESTNTPIKFLWAYASNFVTMHPDTKYVKEVLEDESKLEMIVVYDNHMTPTAKYADILLPDMSSIEREDIDTPYVTSGIDYRIYISPAVKPMFETRDCYSVCQGIARRLGVEEEYTEGKTLQDWLEHFHNEAKKDNPDMISFDEFKQKGIVRLKKQDPLVSLKEFREDPEANPLKTESGKIELYSSRMAREAKEFELEPGQVIKALPEYIPEYRGYNDKLASQFPLQLIGWHPHKRANSAYDNVDFLREFTDRLWMNSVDAEQRGLIHGDRVEVFNDIGSLTIELKVTSRVMPGVIAMPIGAWNKPDKNGVDQNSAMNILTYRGESTYCKGSAQHTNLAEVKLYNRGRGV